MRYSVVADSIEWKPLDWTWQDVFGRLDAIAARMEAAVERQAGVTRPDEPHRYLSTGCLHGEHGYCAAMVGAKGVKRGATCKFCDARCVCACHETEETRHEIEETG